MKILVTGGAGHEVTVLDNLCNASREGLRRVEELTGKVVDFHQVDLLDYDGGDQVFASCPDLEARELGWKAIRGLEEMCEDAWRWQSKNPKGFC